MKKLIPLSLVVCLLFSCVGKNESKKNPTEDLLVSGLSGKQLAEIHCARCHAFVPPSYLSKTMWEADVLPAMGNRLGIYNGNKQPDSIFGPPPNKAVVQNANIFPEEPLLAKADWIKLIDYYVANAPDSIGTPVHDKKIKIGLKSFEYKEALYNNRPPLTSLVKILPENRGVIFGDGKTRNNILTYLTPDLKLDHSVMLDGSPIDYHEKSDTLFLTTMGRNLFPNDLSHGMVRKLTPNKEEKKATNQRVIIPNLQRPVAMAYGDLDNDGLEDIVACEYGDLTGKLVWYKNEGNDSYTANTLNNNPGAITAIIKDNNDDGLNDIFVLMAQGNEGIFYYENQGNGTFREKRLLSFLPLYGSLYMEMADFNDDGFDDIVYVCGDNADKTPILKDYHGVYIFLNDGKLNFDQAYFYQQNGAYKAMPRDYDLDGDLDIAAISYFPDYLNYPEESFVYLENKGDLTFDAFSFPEATNGRWIVMDAEDMDDDGDIDLALGSFVSFLAKGDTTGLSKRWLTESPSVIILENTTK
ncbi:FG-GAP repeat domain-containing protein [Kriegella aquimaris]|uniref:Repeat domain-containing protein n=1 Tax=Kriegella aquimaris TaxID=192904 RepID=A0A1G9N3X3_9FLAO|nr:VCBS repeat-containing protein [Kriegella aquimaris]SDL80807.1 Repeat domain-containing protein [Kriegella aquimaris]